MGRYNLDSGIIDDKSDKSSNVRQQQEQQRASQEGTMAAGGADHNGGAGTSGSFETSAEVRILILMKCHTEMLQDEYETIIQAVINAAIRGETQNLLELLDKNAISPDVHDDLGNTALHIAAAKANDELVRLKCLKSIMLI